MTERKRLTITLREEILRRIDEVIDGVRIRNRSHAIDYFLSQILSPKVSQGVILAGGEGVKMRPITYEIPKALIPVNGRPLIEHTIELLRNAGIREIIIAIGYLGEKIKEAIGNGQKFGVKIIYSKEDKFLGSGGALKNAHEPLTRKPFLLINGDVLIQINLSEFINFHQEDKYIGTMALTNASDTKGFGTVKLRGEKILDFDKSLSAGKSHLIDAGVYIFNPEVFNFFPKKGKVALEEVFIKLAKENKLSGFSFEGNWFEISTPKNYERAIREWK